MAAERGMVPLTAEQRHYLLKALICAQMLDEWALLDETDGLKQYGPPFLNNGSPSPKQVGSHAEQNVEHTGKPVVLIHLFHVHLRRFPGLKGANVQYWRQRILPFFEKVAAATFSNCQERAELTNRKILAFVATRYLATFWSRGVGVRGEGETKGAGKGEKGSEAWSVGKKWGKGTVKRGMDRPVRANKAEVETVEAMFSGPSDGLVWKTAGLNTERVKRDWSAWKEEIIESEAGLSKTLELLEVKSLANLPAEYRNATEWVRRHVAFVLWTLFVQYPGGDEIMSIIKIIHSLFPYWGAKQLLKIANAQKMIKAIIDLVLARPVGMIDSLGQRIFFAVMNGEISSINKTFLTPLRKAIQDDKLCTILDNYVKNRTSTQRAEIMRDARRRECDTLVCILEAYGYGEMEKIVGWQREYLQSAYQSHLDWAYPPASLEAKKMTTRPPEGLQSASAPGALQFARLKLYLREQLRRRDREKVLEIGSGPLVPGIIKDSLEIVFYQIIYQIALVSDLSSRLGDLQRFVDDLIQVKEKKLDSLEDWIALCARHENSLYVFVHEIRMAIKPVFDWCQEALDYMALSTCEPWNASNRKASKVEVNLDDMLEEANEDADFDLQALFGELDDLVDYTKWSKVVQEVQMRKEYVNIRDDSINNVTKLPKNNRQAVVEPSSGMKRDLQELDAVLKRLLASQGVQCDNGKVRNGARGTDIGDVPWAFFGPDDILHQCYGRKEGGKELEYAVPHPAPVPPTLTHLRALLPLFRKRLQQSLPDWPSKALC